MDDEEKFDIFVDYIDSDEWVLPIKSFIDYYCLVFSSEDPEEHLVEKQKVF